MSAPALVTAQLVDGQRGLFAVELTGGASRAHWLMVECGNGQRRHPLWRLTGTCGVDQRADSTCSGLGSGTARSGGCRVLVRRRARAVAGPSPERVANGSDEPHLLAHLGAVDAALAGAETCCQPQPVHIDADPFDPHRRGADTGPPHAPSSRAHGGRRSRHPHRQGAGF